jgi:hypothetical protein
LHITRHKYIYLLEAIFITTKEKKERISHF